MEKALASSSSDGHQRPSTAHGSGGDGDDKEKVLGPSTGDGEGKEKVAKPNTSDGSGIAKAAESRAGDGVRTEMPCMETGSNGNRGGKAEVGPSTSDGGGREKEPVSSTGEEHKHGSSWDTGGMGDGRAGIPNNAPLAKCCSMAIHRYGLPLRRNPSICI